MSTLDRLNSFDWNHFLQQWSNEFIVAFKQDIQIPQTVLESRWLGYPGATEAQISRVESRLKVRLPPSYREFLKVSNGWRQTTPFIYRVWSIEEVDWFINRHQDWIESFIKSRLEAHYDNTQNGHHLNGNCRNGDRPNQHHINHSLGHVTDLEYFLYGEEQDCSKIRYEYLRTALEISDKGESSIYLLNPTIKTNNGEWEAWFFGDWLPGADRYISFKDMMEAEFQNFLDMRDGY